MVTLKRGNAPKAVRRRASSTTSRETKVARLIRERDEALEHQRATSNILKVISRSTFNLQAVLDSLVESAAGLCDADFAFIYRRFGDLLHLAATHGFSGDFIEYQKQNPVPLKRESLTGRTALERKIVHIPDVLEDPEYTWTKSIELAQFRTMLGVPLLREGLPIGVIALLRRTVRPFTDHQIELVTTIADQAVIAIENVRLFEAEQERSRELAESLEQQTATSEVLRVISSSPGDLGPVFAAMLENAVRICDSKFGNIYRWDGEAFHLLAAHNSPPAIVEHRRRTPLRPHPNAPMGRMVATKRLVHVVDAAAEGAYVEQREPAITAAVELGGVRTALYVPMLKENELIGVFTIFRQEVRPFTDKQIEIVQNFAAQAVIAIENTRLLSELRESLAQQTATADVLKVISRSTFDLQIVLDTLTRSAAQLCAADLGLIFQQDGDVARLAANFGVSREAERYWLDHPVPVDRGARPRALYWKAGQSVFRTCWPIPKYRSDTRSGTGKTREVPSPCHSCVTERRSVSSHLPRREPNPFTDKQAELVTTFADQAVIAIENARLLSELRQRTDDLSQRTAGLTEALEQQNRDFWMCSKSFLAHPAICNRFSIPCSRTRPGSAMRPMAMCGRSMANKCMPSQ